MKDASSASKQKKDVERSRGREHQLLDDVFGIALSDRVFEFSVKAG
jgi:hypothetical protein